MTLFIIDHRFPTLLKRIERGRKGVLREQHIAKRPKKRVGLNIH